MVSADNKNCPGAQEGSALGQALVTECTVTGNQCLVPVQETCRTQDEDKCTTGHCSEPKNQEEGLKQEEKGIEPEAETGEEKGPRSLGSIDRPSHGLKEKPVKTEAELPSGTLLLKREEPESIQSERSPSAKQHKKAKKRKSLGAPVLPAVASTVCTAPEMLERKTQRLRPLYQYINYCNPELNQAEGNREIKVDPTLELALVPEELSLKQLQALLPMAGKNFSLTVVDPGPRSLQ
ncbi:hypothetical protein H920_18624 [Fukomys damarensis]|uniref:Uncharacterized protein n=1 Tax=Fukomys damarensis TaxID=885580 RepID=A0A091CPK0_FUKDA|nr:hypothetical protein H920_18624 [Fukomys damarensis]